MRKEIARLLRWWGLILAAIAIGACSNEGNPDRSPPAGSGSSDELRPVSQGMEGRDALRIRKDAARNRLWVLTVDDVRIYDATTNRLIRKIELPNWSVAAFICPPDLVLDVSGSAIVSSNVQPKLWRIDSGGFEATERDITLHERRWETGFGALALAPDGTLLALTSSEGKTVWKIDFDTASARIAELDTDFPSACELTTRPSRQLERSLQP